MFQMDYGEWYEISLVDDKIIEKELEGKPELLDYDNSINFTNYE